MQITRSTSSLLFLFLLLLGSDWMTTLVYQQIDNIYQWLALQTRTKRVLGVVCLIFKILLATPCTFFGLTDQSPLVPLL
jgi:hypothetical protein